MPGGMSVRGNICNGTDYGSVPASTTSTVVSVSATNTKGTWTQIGTLIADTMLLVTTLYSTVGSRIYIVDIGIGSDPNQAVLFSNIVFRSGSPNVGAIFHLPCNLPAGTVLWARLQANTANSTISIKFDGFCGSFAIQGASGGETLGVNLATSTPVTIVTPATPNTKSPWSQIVAATPNNYGSIVLIVAPGQAQLYMSDFAVGPSGSETIFFNNLQSVQAQAPMIWLPIAIPVGARLSVRTQSALASASVTFAILGIFP